MPESEILGVPPDDPLFEDFVEWYKKSEVRPHSELQSLWLAFRAGGTAEHQRIASIFAKTTNNGHAVEDAEALVKKG